MNTNVIARLHGLFLFTLFVVFPAVGLVAFVASSPDIDSFRMGLLLSVFILVALIAIVSLVEWHRRTLVVVAEEFVPSGGLDGRLVGAFGRAGVAQILVWFKYQTEADSVVVVETFTDAEGRFSFALPTDPVLTSWLDLEAGSATMEPGDVVLIVDDVMPSHIRFA